MAIRLSDQQVVEATGGERARGGARASYSAVCTDSRAVAPGSLFVALKGERFDAHDFLKQAVDQGAAGVVVQRGRWHSIDERRDVAVYEVPDTLVALGRLARFHRDRFKVPVGAVTGSNGKTTTKELIASILETRGPALKTQGNLNNEVGVPLTLFNFEPKHVAAIVEMGMNHPGEIARLTEMARPDAGLITTVQRAHLEGVGSIEGVAKAKGELFFGLQRGATAIVNLDDARIVGQAQGLAARVLTFGQSPKAEVRLVKVEPNGRTGLSLQVEWLHSAYRVSLPLVGLHNAMNATAAFAMGLALGYSPEACVQGLEAARPHARRLQVLDGRGGVTVIDDCYNANPASMTAALQTLKALKGGGRAIAVLGDMLELGPDETQAHEQLGRDAHANADVVVLFGTRTQYALAVLQSLGNAAVVHFTESDMAGLQTWLGHEVKKGDVVLVKGSRGMKLERAVEALTGQPSSSGGAH